MMKKNSFEDALILSAIKAAQFFSQILPYRVSLRAGTLIGDIAYSLSKRQAVMIKNLRAVFAAEKSPRELARIARESMRNLGRSGVELLRVPSMDRSFVEKNVNVVGRSKVDEALGKGKGVIFLTAHFGSWELLNIFASLLGYPMVALAREQKHPRSDAYLNSLRRSKGSEVIYKGMPVREILRALRKGRIVGILSDQDAGRNGVFVRFFGRHSSYPKGFAAFSLRTGAPILPAFIFREGLNRHRIEVEGPLVIPPDDLSEEDKEKNILSQFAAILESKIRKDPGQWLWAHRRWKSTPDRYVVVLSDGKAGHRNQSLSMVEAIVRQRRAAGFADGWVHSKTIEVRFKGRLQRNVYRGLSLLFGGQAPFSRYWAKTFLAADCYQELMSSYADIVISAGSSVAGVNLWFASENRARAVALMDPGVGLKRFHAVIAPQHDHLWPRPNIFETRLALTNVNAELLGRQASLLRTELNLGQSVKKIGVLIGGDTGVYKFDKEKLEGIICEINRAAAQKKAVILGTTSRRTPPWADLAVQNVFESGGVCPLLIIANKANRNGVVAGILGLADAVVVSGESISMVSEAVASGRPVVVIEPYHGYAAGSKHEVFLNQLAGDGLIQRAQADNLFDKICFALQDAPQDSRQAELSRDQEILHLAAERITR